MSNATLRVPKLCKHRATGQAVVRLNGKDFHLGRYGSAAANADYDRLITTWLANDRQLPRSEAGLSVAELILAYVRHAKSCYAKQGRATSEFELIRQSMKALKALHAKTPVDEFGPKAFKAVLGKLIAAGLTRRTVNAYPPINDTSERRSRKSADLRCAFLGNKSLPRRIITTAGNHKKFSEPFRSPTRLIASRAKSPGKHHSTDGQTFE